MSISTGEWSYHHTTSDEAAYDASEAAFDRIEKFNSAQVVGAVAIHAERAVPAEVIDMAPAPEVVIPAGTIPEAV